MRDARRNGDGCASDCRLPRFARKLTERRAGCAVLLSTASCRWRRARRLCISEGICMARISLRQLLDHAAEHGYGVPAFNINNMEQALAIMTAADAVDAPVIIQASRGARQYANDVMLKHMMDALTEIYPHIPVCVHLDHGNNAATCMTAIQAGFTSVMMDGSLKEDGKTPGDWEYNVGVTRTVTDMAHLGGIAGGGELGVLGSLETGMRDQEAGQRAAS